ncbi:MAG TPA: hypothetical protein VJ227_00885 [Patescibacteria group bacterium]|nr:hypothetical protein [Patescibacteria group bacterium]
MKQGDIIIFLGSGRLYVSDGSRILSMDFPAGSVRDWDLLNKEVLQDTLSTFITANNIEPSPISFVLSEPACFSKDFSGKDPEKLEAEIANFLDAVPFNYLVSKTYKIGEGVRVIAGNKELIDAISEVFEGRGFSQYAVVPAAIFPKIGVKNTLDVQFVKAVNDNGEIVQTGNMIAPKPLSPENVAPPRPVITKGKASSGVLPYLIIVGVVAIIVLVALVVIRG